MNCDIVIQSNTNQHIRSKVLIHTIAWLNLDSMMPHEGNQTQKATSCGISFTSHSRNRKTIGTERRSLVFRAKEREELILKGHGETFGIMKKFFISIVVVVIQLYIYQNSLYFPPRNGKFYYR